MTMRDAEVQIRRLLSATARVEPSPELDRRIRALLRAAPPRALIQPFAAAGIGIAALLAMGAGLSIAFAESGAAEAGLPMALLAVTGYLTLSLAVTGPLLLVPRLRRRAAR